MKRAFFILMFMFGFSTLAFAGILMTQWTEGMNRYCRYSDGTIITVSAASLCPLSN